MGALLWQVTVPTSGDNAWVWVAGVLGVACGTLFWKLNEAKDLRATSSEAREGTCVSKLEVCVSGQREVTQALREVGASAVEAVEITRRNEAHLVRLVELWTDGRRRS